MITGYTKYYKVYGAATQGPHIVKLSNRILSHDHAWSLFSYNLFDTLSRPKEVAAAGKEEGRKRKSPSHTRHQNICWSLLPVLWLSVSELLFPEKKE